MARRPREDGVDTWHHVMNRAIAKRPMFENRLDMRVFLALLAREVRRGTLEIHAYSLMLTHFHLLVRSPVGRLSAAMQRVQTSYSRWFNRSRRRDGALVRGRFLSCPVHDLAYRRNLVSYIHDNAIDAGVVANQGDYRWSSAWHWERPNRPRWLATDWITVEIRARGARTLEEAFPRRLDEDFRRWVERKLSRRLPEELADATMRHVAAPRTVRWAIRKTQLADGTRPFHPLSPARIVEAVVHKALRIAGPLLGHFKRRQRDAWTNLRAGVLRALSGCTQHEIGLRLDRHNSTVCRDLKQHRELLETVPGYESLHTAITSAVLEEIRRRAPTVIA